MNFDYFKPYKLKRNHLISLCICKNKNGPIVISTGGMEELGNPEYIKLLVDEKGKRIAFDRDTRVNETAAKVYKNKGSGRIGRVEIVREVRRVLCKEHGSIPGIFCEGVIVFAREGKGA